MYVYVYGSVEFFFSFRKKRRGVGFGVKGDNRNVDSEREHQMEHELEHHAWAIE